MLSFSVIIPTRNRPQFLRGAVESALAQSHPPLEVLVVDDGKGAASTLHGLSSVKILDNTERGPVPARILGVERAQGDVIAFLDDDDWWTDRSWLAKAAVRFAEGAEFCFGDGTLVFDDGRPALPFAYDANAETLARDNTILISAVCYRRMLHEILGAFDATLPYYWDWDWYLRVVRSDASFVHLSEPVVAIRVHAQNMSGAEQEQMRRENLERLAEKHWLPPIPLKNHLDIAEAGTADQKPSKL
ncbi:glycosyltransferase [Aestuariivirga sp.]|uniref:glycosyltransferase n=1 Tax=Aestuariivirga sp. TaxID=2650926 RepID=UPI0039E60473